MREGGLHKIPTGAENWREYKPWAWVCDLGWQPIPRDARPYQYTAPVMNHKEFQYRQYNTSNVTKSGSLALLRVMKSATPIDGHVIIPPVQLTAPSRDDPVYNCVKSYSPLNTGQLVYSPIFNFCIWLPYKCKLSTMALARKLMLM